MTLVTERTDNYNWVLCPNCKHKLFKKIDFLKDKDEKKLKTIEIKCHSCRKISTICI